ncbi:Protein kinase alk2 [Mortierella claussenii]|nr:Protein kinase alk2 [Mortierella claussenii]
MANPRVMKNLVQEIDSVLQGSEEGIKYEVLMNEMPYAKAVLHETLRLHPPVPKNVKQAVADDVLPDGTRIYKGEFIGYSSWCMARNQAVWGVDAEMFVPERWLVPDESSKNQSDRSSLLPSSLFGKFRAESHFKFNSFNAGPRLCLGQTFAILEAMVTTCILLQRFEFKLIPNHPVPTVKRSITLPMKKPLMTIVTRRENTSALHQR